MTVPRRSVFAGWYVDGGAFLVLFLAYSVLYAFGALITPLAHAFDTNRAGIAGVFGVTLGLSNALGFLSGVLADRIGPRPLVVAGGLLIGGGMLLASRADSLWHLYLTYSLGVGLGLASIKVPATEVVQHWFVRRRGFATGVAVAGIGAGNLVAPPGAAVFIRSWSWQTLFILLAFGAAVGILLASRLLVASPEARGLQPDGDSSDARNAAALPSPPQTGLSVREALRTPIFWLLYAAVLISALGAYIPTVHLVPDAEAHGIHPVAAAVLLGLIGVGSIGGRFLVSGSADRFGRRRSLLVSLVGMGLFLAWWLVADQFWSLAVFAIGFGIWYGSFSALSPALAADYFGARHAGAVIGVLYTALVPGCVLGPILAGWAYDRTDTYTLPIAASVVTMAIGALCAFLLPEPGRQPSTAAVPAPGTSS